jgi:hypothetical protein
MGTKRLIGILPDQIPRNSDLGTLAFQSSEYVRVTRLASDSFVAVGKAIASHPLDVVGDLNNTGSYRIGGNVILSTTTLGNSVVNSSLTSVGTITSGTWSGLFGNISGANLTNLTAGNLTGTIPSVVLGNSSLYVGTTQVALNRPSGNLALSGITSIQ